jgi:integrase
MTKHNPRNERIKHVYFDHLKEASGRSEATVDAVAKALDRFEADTKYLDFSRFHPNKAKAFKRRLAEQRGQRSGQALSKATQYSTLTNLKRFFVWLADQPGYKSRIQYSDAEYFNLSEKDTRIATASRDRAGPTVEQVNHVISTMPANSEIERRNRTLVAFTLLTGARDSAIASMKIKHVDLAADKVIQDARDVDTKNSKTFTTFFFPVGDEIRAIVADWVKYLRTHKLWGNDDPLFPATRVVVSEKRHFEAAGVERKHWSTASPIREIFRKAFTRADLPYFNPHSFRKTLAQHGERLCKTPEQFKAWSQNLGHEKVMTTLLSYGEVAVARQGQIFDELAKPQNSESPDIDELLDALSRKLRNSGTR